MIFLYIIKESFLYAINSLRLNKLRTFLSLLGITIGIFAIISVFTVIDSLENYIRNSIATLGDNVVYVEKWPWSFGSNYPWWKYIKRPVVKPDEMDELMRRSQKAKAAAFVINTRRNMQYGNISADNVAITAATHDYENIRTFDISSGRYFTFYESASGAACAILGSNLAEQFFPGQNPVGKEIKLGGNKLRIVGIFKKEGSDMFGISADDQVFIPLNYARNIVNLRDDNIGPTIMIKAKDNVSVDELIDELQGLMRALRRLKPMEEDDFALNKSSLISQGFEGVFVVIDVSGLIIGGFSILVGGFGIANIMFVSVKEQTQVIGIQKALGAKNYFILLQFLYEASLLSLIGGILGLLLIFIITSIVKMASSFDFSMSLWNITVGLLISITIGVLSGFVPAWKASKLNPVEAINSVG